MKIAIRFSALLLVSASLLGCQSSGTRPELGIDNTGDLGDPVKRVSPADVYVELGTAYLREGNINEAFRNARKAVLVDEGTAKGHNLLGVVYQHLGQVQQAGQHYQRAVALSPRDPFALNAYGSYLCSQGDYDQADQLFRRALENPLYPTPWMASHNAGLCAETAGNPVEAETYFRAALSRNPQFAPSLLRMAQLSFDTDNYLSARAYLQRFAQVAKHTAHSLWLGLRTERQLGDRDQEASYALKLRANFPDSEQARYLNEAE